jgi:hypothetical protein
MLFGASARPKDSSPPRIILGLDCTSSMGEYLEPRKITTEAASGIANGLFAEAGSSGLEVQLVYFRGDDRFPEQPRQLGASKRWYSSAAELARAIVAVEHWPGWTQHCRLLRHAISEAENKAVRQVVIISDAFERRSPRRPDGDDPAAARVHAARLRDLGVKLVVGYKGTIAGGCPFNRAGIGAEQTLRAVADENGGYVFLCDPASDPEQLVERFAEIVAQARLSAQGDHDGAQRLMLEHKQTVTFDMTVEERVSSAHCALQAEESEE